MQTRHAVVGAAEQGEPIFHSAKNRIGQVLPLFGAFAEPAVIGEVNEKIHIVLRRIARRAGECVFKADEWCDFMMAGRASRSVRWSI